MDKIKLGIVGLGARGMIHLQNLLLRDDVEVTALSDNREQVLTEATSYFKTQQSPQCFCGDQSYKALLDAANVDVVIIAVPWQDAMPMASFFVKHNIHVGVEAASANSVEECLEFLALWKKHQAKVMILENVCYRRDIMAVLNMVKQGLFGEVLHCRAGYEHDLRKIKFESGRSNSANWRIAHSFKRNGDLYPTHGIGPIARILDINRSNYFKTLYSVATKSRGLKRFAQLQGKDENLPDVVLGDVVTTFITTTNGETIVLTHDTNLPRPYSLGLRVQGTEGIWIKDTGNLMYFEEKGDEAWEDADRYLEEYDHPLWKKYEKQAAQTVRHEMDFFVLEELLSAIKEDREPELNVYDYLTWTIISPLSERSIAEGKAVDFPKVFQNISTVTSEL